MEMAAGRRSQNRTTQAYRSLGPRPPMSGPVIQPPINFSEGRRAEVIEAIADSVKRVPGAILADCSADSDHNRMVTTILGGPDAILHAAIASARTAAERID